MCFVKAKLHCFHSSLRRWRAAGNRFINISFYNELCVDLVKAYYFLCCWSGSWDMVRMKAVKTFSHSLLPLFEDFLTISAYADLLKRCICEAVHVKCKINVTDVTPHLVLDCMFINNLDSIGMVLTVYIWTHVFIVLVHRLGVVLKLFH